MNNSQNKSTLDLLSAYSQEQNIDTESFVEKEHTKIIHILKFIIISTEAVLITVLILNSRVDKRLSIVQENIENLEKNIRSKQDVEKTAKEVIEKTELYKTIYGEKKLLSKKVAQTMSSIPQSITVKSIKITHENFNLNAMSPSALDFSLLINRYFEKKLVSEINLKSANLDVYTNQFNIEIEANYK